MVERFKNMRIFGGHFQHEKFLILAAASRWTLAVRAGPRGRQHRHRPPPPGRSAHHRRRPGGQGPPGQCSADLGPGLLCRKVARLGGCLAGWEGRLLWTLRGSGVGRGVVLVWVIVLKYTPPPGPEAPWPKKWPSSRIFAWVGPSSDPKPPGGGTHSRNHFPQCIATGFAICKAFVFSAFCIFSAQYRCPILCRCGSSTSACTTARSASRVPSRPTVRSSRRGAMHWSGSTSARSCSTSLARTRSAPVCKQVASSQRIGPMLLDCNCVACHPPTPLQNINPFHSFRHELLPNSHCKSS